MFMITKTTSNITGSTNPSLAAVVGHELMPSASNDLLINGSIGIDKVRMSVPYEGKSFTRLTFFILQRLRNLNQSNRKVFNGTLFHTCRSCQPIRSYS
jgi:hypothetical protein